MTAVKRRYCGVYRVYCYDGNSGSTVQVLAWTRRGLKEQTVKREAAKMTGCKPSECTIERFDSVT